jgi:hypothetical protein
VLEFPSEWVPQFGAHLTTAFPPTLGARVRYYERLRPQPSFGKVVQRILASDLEFRVHHAGEMTKLVTAEGEYGAWIALDGRREGAPAKRFIAVVFMEEFATAIDVLALIPEHFARAEGISLELARAQRFEMTRRPRLFEYTPPPGWHGIASGSTATWYPLEFPRKLASIAVPPASSFAGGLEAAAEQGSSSVEAGLAIETRERSELSTPERGVVLTVRGTRPGVARPTQRELAIFVVADRAYRVRLEAMGDPAWLDEVHAIFLGVASSIQPLPSSEDLRP